MATWISINIDSDNGLLLNGTKPLPDPNFGLSSLQASHIHLTAISEEIPQQLINEISLKIAYVKFH